MTPGRLFWAFGGLILVVLIVLSGGQIIEVVNADEVAVCQFPNGSLVWWLEPGLHLQWFGRVTHYRKSNQYWFSKHPDQGPKVDQAIQTRFNDAGTARVSGGVRYDMPLGVEQLTMLHSRYGSAEAVEHQLVRPVMEKSIYLTGPLMSSKEVFSTGSGRFLSYIEDQATNGVFRTVSQAIREKDDITGEVKTVTLERVVQDKEAPGGMARVDESPLKFFGIKLYNVVINSIDPDSQVQTQIAEQQRITMEVQTSMARAKQAEQQALTAQKEGEAAAAKAKWEQEAIRAKEVTRAEQEKQVAVTQAQKEKLVAETNAEREKNVALLKSQAAEFYNKEQKLRADADSTYKREIMAADGALQQKLEAWKDVNARYAAALERHTGAWVPQIVMGQGAGQQNASTIQDLLALFMAKAAKDLALEVGMQAPAAPKR